RMPTVLIVAGFKFAFFSTDRGEPRHIHVVKDRAMAKFWLDPVSLAKSRGFADHEINAIERMVVEYRGTFQKAWDDYFGA
ncbi:MAG TPA: DUF4160 domain-containing protein, partial [Longimicrobium sp.]|nr:DUF4160 domain-containing protein [Longimicrobium sp.]